MGVAMVIAHEDRSTFLWIYTEIERKQRDRYLRIVHTANTQIFKGF